MLANLAKRIKHWLLEKIANGQPVILNVDFIGTVEIDDPTNSVIESGSTCARQSSGVLLCMRPVPMYYYVCTVPDHGDDANDGLSADTALATVKRAVSLADEKFGDRILILDSSWYWHKPSELTRMVVILGNDGKEICVG